VHHILCDLSRQALLFPLACYRPLQFSLVPFHRATSQSRREMTAATSVGNLTTIFTPAPSCLTDIYRFNASYIYTEDGQVQTFQYTALGPTSTSACVPSGFAPTAAYYSPGICPSGYVQACSSVVTSGSTAETQATCCPMSVTKAMPSL
jgi:hypothetical protein